MFRKVAFARIDLIATVCTFLLSSVAFAQDASTEAANPEVFTETFDEGDPSVMLGGQISFETEIAPWILHVSDGKLVIENRTSAASIFYNDVAWVNYSDVLESTAGSVISAVVEAKNEGSGGAGILVGSGINGAYLAFAVDAEGQYHVFKKNGRDVRRLNSGKSAAVRVGQPNEVALKFRGKDVVFFVNSVQIIKVPYEMSPGSENGGLGLSAFGIGTFKFNSVEISRSN